MASGDVGEGALVTLAVLFSLLGGAVVELCEVRGEELAAVWAEDPVVVEGAEGFQECLFADVDHFGVALVAVGAGPVVGTGVAAVVGLASPVAGVHAAPAAVQDVPAKHVGAKCLGVGVRFVPVA